MKRSPRSTRRIIYTNCYGYGRRGPERDLPAYDDTIQAECGIPAVQEQLTGEANYVGTIMADKVAGLTALYATMMALFHRERTGEGQEVEVSMFETMASFMLVEHANGAMFDPPLGPAVYPRTVAPNRRPYRTSDGYIAALIYNDKHWNAFVNAVRPAWATDLYATLERRARQIDTVYGLLAETMKERTTAEWLALFRELQIPAAPLNTPDCAVRPSSPERGRLVRDGGHTSRSRAVPGCADVVFAYTGEGRRSRAAVGRGYGAGARRAWSRLARRRARGGIGIGANVDFEMGQKAADLRRELRELVKDNVPEHFLGAFTDDPADLETAQRFCRTLAERNLLCLAWPEEFGGGGASVWEQTVVREEMWAHHEPRGAQYMGVNWVGPIIMRHGTEEQQRKHLPPIARGEVIWCQGFSEPEAGSDLASLRTAARRDGDGWLVSGQKIWTSYATMAQWCFLLARTSQGREETTGPDDFPCADG